MELLAVDLFCGAGGLSLGAEMAGIKVVLANEINESAATTYKHNHPNVKLIQGDVRSFSVSNFISINPFVVMGGPPCQGFSISNTRTRNDNNKSNYLFFEFIRIICESQPDWFVFENVEGIVSYNYGKTVLQIKEIFNEIGYTTNEDVLYASDYGVPQHRNRFFMIGNKKSIPFNFPPKTNNPVTVRDALIDLPDLKNGQKTEILPYKNYQISDYSKLMRQNSMYCSQNFVSQSTPLTVERYKHIRPGQNWRQIPKILMTNYKDINNCHSGIYKRLDPDKPSVVISNFRKNMLIHPFEDRGLSIREAARLQSFPDTYEFKGFFSHQQQQIGNAVPPLLAKAIFVEIVRLNNIYEEEHSKIALEV